MTALSLSDGKRLGPYEILAKIGAGGMGEVYRARDTRLDRVVALKVLSPEHANPLRFEREAKALSSFTHPNICTIHDFGVDSGSTTWSWNTSMEKPLPIGCGAAD